jgi:hypothetical protein
MEISVEEALTPPEPQLLAVLAREIATDSLKLKDLLAKYQLDEEYYQSFVASSPYFQKLLESYTAEWESVVNTPRRLAFIAQTALEEKLPVLAARLGDRREGFSDAVAAAKLFKELGGIATPAPSAAQLGERFTITINLGGNTVQLETKPVIEEPSPLELTDGQTRAIPER